MKAIIDVSGASNLSTNAKIYVNLTRPGDTPYSVVAINNAPTLPTVKDINEVGIAANTAINSGDYFKVETSSGVSYTSLSITLIYKPTNTNLGTWTIYS